MDRQSSLEESIDNASTSIWSSISSNGSSGDGGHFYGGVLALPEPNLWCLALVLLPATCIFGNFLVVSAVLNERSLKTSTNFLLVSLACADLLVGTLVMPFSVYLTINRLNWFLPDAVCNFFCVADVSASTASIVHLVAISVDRFYAVVYHMEYKSPRHKRRVYCTILFSWVFSIGIGLPLGIGMNQSSSGVDSSDPSSSSGESYRCGIVNPDYMLYMSIFAFYIPCSVMSVMYGFVFYRLHRRMRAIKLQEMAAGQMVHFGDHLGNIFQSAYGGQTASNVANPNKIRNASMMWAMPFLKTIEATIAENEDMSTEELDELTTILHTLESDPQHHIVGGPRQGRSGRAGRVIMMNSAMMDCPEEAQRILQDGLFRATGRRLSSLLATARGRLSSDVSAGVHLNAMLDNELSYVSTAGHRGDRRRSLYVAKQKIKTLKDRAIELLMRLRSRQGMAIRKETRATKLVSTVMLVFLLCYMPFFTLNIVKVYMLRRNTWSMELEGLFIFFTWLGYVNSCLNPLIYSLFNRKFRATFQKLLHCPGDHSSEGGKQKRLSRAIADSEERKALIHLRSWIASQKQCNAPPIDDDSSPMSEANGLLSDGAAVGVAEKSKNLSISRTSIHHSGGRLPSSRGTPIPPSMHLDPDDEVNLVDRPPHSHSIASHLSSLKSGANSNFDDEQYEMEDDEEEELEEYNSDSCEFDVDDEPNAKYPNSNSRQKHIPAIVQTLQARQQQKNLNSHQKLGDEDAELAMLRRAQFSGYNIIYDQIRDFNEPVEV